MPADLDEGHERVVNPQETKLLDLRVLDISEINEDRLLLVDHFLPADSARRCPEDGTEIGVEPEKSELAAQGLQLAGTITRTQDSQASKLVDRGRRLRMHDFEGAESRLPLGRI